MSDKASLWFEALEEMGQKSMMGFGRYDIKNSDIKWRFINHKEFDGIGGLISLSKENNIDTEKLTYKLANFKKISFIGKIKSILAYLPETKIRMTTWLHYDRSAPLKSSGIYHHYLSTEQLTKLKSLAKENRCSLQIYLLKILDAHLSMKLLDEKERWWLVPINMRSKKTQFEVSNKSSYIGIPISDHDNYRDIQSKFISKLKNNSHWAAWFFMDFFAMFGKKFIRKVLIRYQTSQHGWTGIFTFLDYQNEHDHDFIWCGVPPITEAHPISFNLAMANDNLIICGQAHQGIVKNYSDWKSIMDEYVELLFR